jgi:hypothetical protein
LNARTALCIWWGMTQVPAIPVTLEDRARLRERFFGAARTARARSRALPRTRLNPAA